VRELVYLSERKLRQFQEPKRKRFSIREITIPGVGQVGIDQSTSSHLDAVVAHLEGISHWYEEKVPVGQWVHFEAQLGHRILSSDSGLRVLMFAEPAGRAGTRRLVLHGAPEHLFGPSRRAQWGDEEPATIDSSHGEAIRPLMWHLATTAAEGRTSQGHYRDDLLDLVGFLDQEIDPRTTAWMAGFARITVDTADLPIVVASPLLVEYVSAPDQ
jgi:hypothetical protein